MSCSPATKKPAIWAIIIIISIIIVVFSVDASQAGAGNLEISVCVGDTNVPNFVKSEGNARFTVSFTPQITDTHMINVKFNANMVPG